MKTEKKASYSSFHNPEPDYTKPLFEFSSESRNNIFERLLFLYGEATATKWMPELERICQVYYAHKPQVMIERDEKFVPTERFTEKDLIVITYGDLIDGDCDSPLENLAKFCETIFDGGVNTLHILPFFPYSSDRGFSIIDFETVDPGLGSWSDINALDERFELMFDGVVNHISSQSKWFKEFLNGNAEYKDFFISYDSPDALTKEQREIIFRPRTSDILSKFQTLNGPRYVWTTFSSDQIDLNYANPRVLTGVLDILLFYIRHGANIIRLDAVTYLWAELGTPCVHLEQTHQIIKLFRDILDALAPQVALITETNVPHKDNISYFGNGHDEAHMIYNFTLPPLVLHTFYQGNSVALTKWAQELKKPSDTTHFFNFLDSHDGVGLMGVDGILSKTDIEFIIDSVKKHGGIISYKSGKDGEDIPYEMNITWYSAINCADSDESVLLQVNRFIASRTIAFVLQGVPGIYFHSIVGTENDLDAVKTKKSNRAINRSKINADAVYKELKNPESKISYIAEKLKTVCDVHIDHRAFHPNGPQRIYMLSPDIFTILRTSPEGDEHILCLISIVNKVSNIKIKLTDIDMTVTEVLKDILTGNEWKVQDGVIDVVLQPYDTLFFMAVG